MIFREFGITDIEMLRGIQKQYRDMRQLEADRAYNEYNAKATQIGLMIERAEELMRENEHEEQRIAEQIVRVD